MSYCIALFLTIIFINKNTIFTSTGLVNIINSKMSKSPKKDFSRLIETNVKTAKKEERRRDELLYPSYQPRY